MEHLLFAIYTTEEVYYRVYIRSDEKSERDTSRNVAVLEKREGPGGKWNELITIPPTELGGVLPDQ